MMQFVLPFRRVTLDFAALAPTRPAHLAHRQVRPTTQGLTAQPATELVSPARGRCVLVARWERDTAATVDVCGEAFPAGLLRMRWQLADPEATGDG